MCLCIYVSERESEEIRNATNMFAHVGIFTCDCAKKKNACALYVFGDVLCFVVVASNDLFFPITLLHTCGSFTFMVIQIMKLSIRGILW